MSKHPWPKLSESLTHPRDPRLCQACGWDCDLHRWREHDDFDRPTDVIVVLCLRCEKLIEPHPRLYDRLEDYAPHPGSMVLCEDCSWRNGLRCTHEDLRANGGSGLGVQFPMPHAVHVCGTRGGRRTGWMMQVYPGPPSSCAGRAALAESGGVHSMEGGSP